MPKRIHPPKSSAQRPPSGRGSAPGGQGAGQRLQKVLAAAGLGSRRHCEELIVTGRVEVDRQCVTELGSRVDPAQQEIRVDGQPIRQARYVYYAVNKPPGVVSTNRDPAQRTRVIDLVPASGKRLFPIGRLDLNSEGLILVTNDGELANRLTHPRYEVPKTYRVLVAGRPGPDLIATLCRGVHLAEGIARADRVEIRSFHKESTVLEIVLREGRNREIRRVLARLGHKVMRLVRLRVGPVRLGELAPGQARPLSHEEVAALRGLGAPPATRRPPRGSSAPRPKRRPAGPPASSPRRTPSGRAKRRSRRPHD